MSVIVKLLAAAGLLLCLALMLHMFLGPRRQQRVEAALRRAWAGLRARALMLWHWRASRRHAQRVTNEIMRRAREHDDEGEWEGNVYRPKSFRKPRKPH